MTTWTTVDANGRRFTHATKAEAERFAREHGGEVAVLPPRSDVNAPQSAAEGGMAELRTHDDPERRERRNG